MWQVDESATGSVNFFGPRAHHGRRALRGQLPLCVLHRSRIVAVHLRMPSIDRGVSSFLWAVVFFLFLYFGMLAIAIDKGTAFVISLVTAFLLFLFVRTRGADPVERG
jgi:hypothetical protein